MSEEYLKWKKWQDVPFGMFSQEDSLYFAEEMRACGVKSVANLRIGEAGYGNGGFAGWVRHAKGQWTGLEKDPELQRRAMASGFDTISAKTTFSAALGPNSLDVVIAFDLIEHLSLEELRAFWYDAKEVLRAEGLLVLRTPSGDSPFSGAIARGDLTHQTILGSDAVRQLAEEVGMRVIRLGSPVMPLAVRGIGRKVRRVALRIIQGIAFRGIATALMNNPDAVISPNMIIVLRKSIE